ncbi:hypothetical protein FIBSPDRAFT_968638 [Athelia psychrophila]|uniref:Uncharacterized protein n=1 Tax=Athelia psychrophila TaxID=1759441 RepID=A0A167UEG1_9AGAM|nr:hypothetical protein FIBSPDRAFT_968638 [Fibularhizoctonia sp. CBS 109695]
MADDVPEFLPFGDRPSGSMLPTSSSPATLPRKRLRSTDEEQGPRQRPGYES